MPMTELEKRASRMKWNPPAPGSKERNEMPKSAFLSPSTRTFPYKVLIDSEWVVSEKGLRSAISVANFRGNPSISAKASKMLDDLLSNEASHNDQVGRVLAHFGIPGMKWGVRRDRERSSRTTSSEHKQSRISKKTPMSQMTNVQLRQYVERMNLEQQYKRLNPSAVSSGKSFAVTILREVGKETVKEVIKTGIKALRK